MEEFEIEDVIEFGCGDGNQLTLANYPKYLGLDVSETAIEICRNKFQNDSRKSFSLMDGHKNEHADAALSLDVIFHLVEDPVFDQYMLDLFSAGRKLIVIYASNTNEQDTPKLPHVRHRELARWVETNQPRWSLKRVIENTIPYNKATGIGSPASFYVYEMLQP
jgi:SAM-dependent methyltransferase